MSGHLIMFLQDNRAIFSVHREFLGFHTSLSLIHSWSAWPIPQTSLNSTLTGSSSGHFPYSPLFIPSFPIPLPGRDMLSKSHMNIACYPNNSSQGMPMSLPLLSSASIYILSHSTKTLNFSYPLSPFPTIWDTTSSFLDAQHKILSIKLSAYISKFQQSLHLTNFRDLKLIIQSILSKTFLYPASPPYNTPILAVEKELTELST